MIVQDVGQHMVHEHTWHTKHVFQVWYWEPEQKCLAEAHRDSI